MRQKEELKAWAAAQGGSTDLHKVMIDDDFDEDSDRRDDDDRREVNDDYYGPQA